jgi:hypothetical protein
MKHPPPNPHIEIVNPIVKKNLRKKKGTRSTRNEPATAFPVRHAATAFPTPCKGERENRERGGNKKGWGERERGKEGKKHCE